MSFREIDDPVERIARFLDQLQRLELSEFPGVAKQLEAGLDEWTEFEIRLFVWAWARLDPADALDGALHWAPALRKTTGYAAVRSWARENPAAAQVAVHTELEHTPRDLGTTLMMGLAHGWAESGNFDGVLEFIDERFSAVAERESLIETLAQRMLRVRGLDDTFQWAERTAARYEAHDRALLSIVFRKIARNAVATDPEKTMAWLTRFEGDDSYMSRARRAGAVAWGREDPIAALGWLLSRPPPPLSAAIETIVPAWFEQDETAARAWLEREARPALDPVVSQLASRVARRSPEDALDLLDLIQAPADREQALISVIARWYADDVASAMRWMERETSSETFRAEVAAVAGSLADARKRRDRGRTSPKAPVAASEK